MTAGVAQFRDVQARGLEHVERVGLERALGHGDAQWTLGAAARGMVAIGCSVLDRGARSLQALERKGKARRRHLDAVAKCAGKDGVVASTRTDRIGQATGIGLKDQARVVIKRVHDGEVEGQHLGVLGSQALDQGTQLARERRDNARRRQQRVDAVEHLGTTVQARQLANGDLNGLGLGAFRYAGIEAHEVVGVHTTQCLGSQFAILTGREQFLKRTHAARDNARIGKRQLAHGLGHQRDDLDIARGVARADELKTQLRKLTRATGIALTLANHRRLIAQAQRQIGRAHASRNQANDRQRVVGTDHQQAAVVIKELKRRVRNAAALLKRTLVLEQRRLDRQVMMPPEAALHRTCNLLARLSLLGQYVPESPRCGRHLVSLLMLCFV